MKKITTFKKTEIKKPNITAISDLLYSRNTKNENIKQKKMKQSSRNWISRHINDPFVKASIAEKYASRAVYKIIEIDNQYGILNQNARKVIDLGCAPGGWTNACIRKYNANNIQDYKIIGVDILSFDHKINKEISSAYDSGNFIFIKGDFLDVKVQENILELCNKEMVDIIMSDISHNISGVESKDRLTHAVLLQDIISFAEKHLHKNGSLVMKSIRGIDFSKKELAGLKIMFEKCHIFKPKSSRRESSEVFLICDRRI